MLVSLFLASGVLGGEPTELNTIAGRPVAPLHCDEDEKFAVVIFITTDCPIANAYMPEINRLTQYISQAEGKLTLVHVDWDLTEKDARRHAEEFGIESPVVIDREHQLVKVTGAEITPEAVLLDREGRIFYKGRINNLYAGYGDKRRAATEHNLRDAIVALLAGHTPDKAQAEAIGCYIPER